MAECPKCGAAHCENPYLPRGSYQCGSHDAVVFDQSDRCRIAELTAKLAAAERELADLHGLRSAWETLFETGKMAEEFDVVIRDVEYTILWDDEQWGGAWVVAAPMECDIVDCTFETPAAALKALRAALQEPTDAR